MTTFDESLHPRASDGTFTEKAQTHPEVGLPATVEVSTTVAFEHHVSVPAVVWATGVPQGTTYEFALGDLDGQPYVVFTLPDGEEHSFGGQDDERWSSVDESDMDDELFLSLEDYATALIRSASRATSGAAWRASEQVLAALTPRLSGQVNDVTPAPEAARQRAARILSVYGEGEDGVAAAISDLVHHCQGSGLDFRKLVSQAEWIAKTDEEDTL